MWIWRLSPGHGLLVGRGYFEQRALSGVIEVDAVPRSSVAEMQTELPRLDTLHDAQEKTFLNLKELVPISGQDVSRKPLRRERRSQNEGNVRELIALEMSTFVEQAADAVEDDVHCGDVAAAQSKNGVEPEFVA